MQLYIYNINLQNELVCVRYTYVLYNVYLCILDVSRVFTYIEYFKQVMTDPDVPGPSDPYLREHLHW